MKLFSYFKFSLIFVALFCITTELSAQNQKINCKIEIYNIETNERTVLKEFPYRVEAPNWTMDGKYLIYNSRGKLYRMDVQNPVEEEIYTGFATSNNNDHVLSFCGTQIAISHHTREDGESRIYTLPITGGTPTLITPMGPSYLHGWSPDGKTLTYCAPRKGNFDVYAIPAEGGVEVRLTDAEGLDDGPEYSPCGKYIWFNSVRTGLMQIWKMNADGTDQIQMTFDENRNSWFPHISPDGEKVIVICYKKGDVNPGDHPGGKHIELRIMPAAGGEVKTLVNTYGGQGTINVNSWAPDSKRFAFVTYIEE